MTFLLLMTPVPQSLILHKAFSFNNQKNKSDKKYSFSYSIPPYFLVLYDGRFSYCPIYHYEKGKDTEKAQ